MTDKPIVAWLVIIVGVTLLTACQPSEPDNNAQIMEDAARSLTFSTPRNDDGNRAYMLEKISGRDITQGVRTKVAVIFGYSNNRVACKAIADELVERNVTPEYDCNAID
jgi:hypothetical protein